MKVVICGAGQVGYNIAAYLSRENNDITVIDPEPQRIARINDNLEANGIVGFPSHPDRLKEAGIADADMIIAVTDVDEINMVACQVAHSLFGVPKKIARIQTTNYLDPSWSNLFARAHMPIDVIISPEEEVAEAILRRVKVPGTSDVISLIDGQLLLVGVHCEENCPVVNTPLKQLRTLFPDVQAQIMAIIRGDERIIVNKDNQMLVGDEVYFIVHADQLYRALAIFGHEEPKARHIVILGGGNIGTALANRMQQELMGTNIKIIEIEQERAELISERLKDVMILRGDGLSKEILKEANIDNAEAFIAVSNDDENNILASLLAKQYGAQRTMTLINKAVYTNLTGYLGIDAVISPRSITVSRMLRHIRRGKIKGVYNIYDGFAEVVEAEVASSSIICDKAIRDLDLPMTVRVSGIWREDELFTPHADFYIREGDRVILISCQEQAKRVEELFSNNINIIDL